MVEAEALLELLDLGSQRDRIGRVAISNTSMAIGQPSEAQSRP
jgi:hypothetical protein